MKVSFANRLPEMRLQITRDQRVLGQLLRCFQQARQHALAPGRLVLQVHLDGAALHGAHHSGYTKVLRAILYRADVMSARGCLAGPQAHHAGARSEAKKHASGVMEGAC